MGSLSEAFTRAVQSHQAGRLTEAEAAYRLVLARDPEHPDSLHLLGVIAHQRGRDEEAIDLIARAIARDPTRAIYHNNYGVALRGLGRSIEAIASHREALRIRPEYADAHSNLGVVLHELGDTDQARVCFETALRLRPDHVDALYNLGNLLRDLGQAEQAVLFYQTAHSIAPHRVDVLNNLGNALAALERIEEAVRCFEEVGRLRPDPPFGPLRAAALCPAVFPSTAMIERYRATLETVLNAHQGAGWDWERDVVVASGCVPSFHLAHHGRNDRPLRSRFAAVFREAAPRPPVGVGSGPPRIGFVVTHPHERSFLRCAGGILNQLTPGRFQPIVFGSVKGVAALQAEILHPDITVVAFPDRFQAAAERIKAARCDLLYHWEVGTDALNYFLPFARLAPAQCASWGVQSTTGVPAIDYYISSALVEAPEADEHYSETLVRLASLLSYRKRAPRPDPPARRGEFGLPDGVHLYLCLQRPAKLHPDFDALLAGILRRDPRGLVLLLRGREGRASERLVERFRQTIPDAWGRIVFLPWRSPATYHRLLSLADVVLDPVHYGAGASAYDIFSHDLPLVTWPGPYNASRYALACYRGMGLSELVAATAERYMELAARLGTDRSYRNEVAARIATASPVLFEDHAVVREHERCFKWVVEAVRRKGP